MLIINMQKVNLVVDEHQALIDKIRSVSFCGRLKYGGFAFFNPTPNDCL
jgi:hypothetical protein